MAEEVTHGQAPTDATQVVTTDTTTTEPKMFDEEYVKGLRSEAAQYRNKLRELEQKQRDAESATLSEAEQLKRQIADLTKERDELNTRQRREMVNRVVDKAAQKVNIDEELIAGLIKTDDLDLDDDDLPKQVEKRIRAVLQKWPHLSNTPDVSPTNGGTGASKPPVTFTRSQLRDPAFYRKHEKEILLAQKEGRILPD